MEIAGDSVRGLDLERLAPPLEVYQVPEERDVRLLIQKCDKVGPRAWPKIFLPPPKTGGNAEEAFGTLQGPYQCFSVVAAVAGVAAIAAGGC